MVSISVKMVKKKKKLVYTCIFPEFFWSYAVLLKLRIYFLPVLDGKGVGERSCVGISNCGTEGRLSVVMTQRVPRRERLALINRLRVDYIYVLRAIKLPVALISEFFVVQVQAGFHPIPGLPS